jgi:DNA-binding CsgD family transcriptional regulator
MAKTDLLRVVEAAYRVESTDEVWLTELMESSRQFMDAGFGVFGAIFDKPPDGAVRFQSSASIGPDWLSRAIQEVNGAMAPATAAQLYDRLPCSTMSQLLGPEFSPSLETVAQGFGVADAMGFIARDTSRLGCIFIALLPKQASVGVRFRSTWNRIAGHIAASLRIRRSMHSSSQMASASASTAEEAVLSADGKVEHASAQAQHIEARQQLTDAVRSMTLARGQLRHDDPPRALQLWQPMVNARWTLVDRFEHDGRRYVLARENEPQARGPQALTTRERQVARLAAIGHSSKLIAYELGIADSTARVLLARSMRKLGAHSRADLARLLGT